MTLSRMKLGKRPRRDDKRTLRLENFLQPGLPSPPNLVDWMGGRKEWGVHLNDRLGSCTIAAVADAVEVWNLQKTGKLAQIPDPTVLSYYEKWDGYTPSDPFSDNGGVVLDVLNDWRKEGFAGQSLIAYAAPRPANLLHVRQAIYMFGGVYVGIQMPVSAQTQHVWDVVPNDGGPWGGHAVFISGYMASENTFTCLTWGFQQRMTTAFFTKYVDEVYCLLGASWPPPKGLDLPALEAALAAVTG